jgi:prephenate dehydrogenase
MNPEQRVDGDKDVAPPAIFIWGMGLIGASLGLSLKAGGAAIAGAVRSEKSRAELLKLGFSEIYTAEKESLAALRRADILVLGLNLRDCYPVLESVLTDEKLARRLVIFDLCSTKSEICAFVEKKFPTARFIGAHPMAGKEKQGPSAAEAGLFAGSTVFITPLECHGAAEQTELADKVAALWRTAGANTAVIQPGVHDRTMAYVSHGLHLASCLVANLSAEVFDPKLSVSPVAGSYRDVTRVVQSSGEMWRDITLSNQTHVSEWLRKLAKNCNELADGVEHGDAAIVELFAEAKKNRERFMRT